MNNNYEFDYLFTICSFILKFLTIIYLLSQSFYNTVPLIFAGLAAASTNLELPQIYRLVEVVFGHELGGGVRVRTGGRGGGGKTREGVCGGEGVVWCDST